MPKYDYKCENCGVFEVQHRISEPALKECPTCGGKIQRLICKNVNVVYKTGGFYTTENRSSDYNKKQKESKKADKAS